MLIRRSSFVAAAVLGILTGCCRERFDPARDSLTIGSSGGWSFAVEGDSRVVSWDSVCVSRKLVRMIAHLTPRPELAVDCGDLVNNPGSRLQWVLFDIQMSPLTRVMPLYPVIGNHDVEDKSSEAVYRDHFHLQGEGEYYSFDHRQGHFVVLDTEVPGRANSIPGGQLSWLHRDLEGVPPTTAIFVFMHRPVFPQTGYRKEPMKDNEEVHRFFSARGVTAVFAGHEHLYNRMERDGVLYFITGGGGAHLLKGYPGSWHHFIVVSMKGSEVRFTTVDKDGKVRDDVTREITRNLH